MKITGIRIVIAASLIYFPIATLGSTGSYLKAVEAFWFMVALIGLGWYERNDSFKHR